MNGRPKKVIKTKRNEIEKTKRTEFMKHPRRCILCGITKDGSQFSKSAIYVCEACYEKR